MKKGSSSNTNQPPAKGPAKDAGKGGKAPAQNKPFNAD